MVSDLRDNSTKIVVSPTETDTINLLLTKMLIEDRQAGKPKSRDQGIDVTRN